MSASGVADSFTDAVAAKVGALMHRPSLANLDALGRI